MKLSFAFWLAFGLLRAAAPVAAAGLDAQNYHRAFALIDSGHVLEAEVFAERGHDTALNKVITGLYLAQPGNDASFDAMTAFMNANPDWPNLKGIAAIAEQKIPANLPAPQVAAWFDAHPPVTLVGFYRCIDAMNITGQSQKAADMVRARWNNGEFSPDELAAFRGSFPQIIGATEIKTRLDRMLWKNDLGAVRQIYPLVDSGLKALAEARIGLAARAANVDALLARVPEDLRNDPGLIYEKLHWYVRNNQDDQALSILRHPPDTSGKPEAWWEQRQIIVRRLIDQKNYDDAYTLAADHGPLESKDLTDAEFLCGWLALRFLNSQEDARRHFQMLYDNAATPVSHARGAYWLGRTYEAHGDKDMAEQFYETAAALNITYYGQLAAARIYEKPMVTATPEPAIPVATRNAFYNRDTIRAIEHLYDMGERDRAHSFFHAAIESTRQRADFALLTELAYRIERPDFAIEAGKAASHKNMLMAAGSFPLLERKLPQPPDPAFTHALIRQESQFNPDAHSPVGAEGLMQLMPGTAKGVAKKIGVTYKPKLLNDPDYNLRLGTAFVQEQIDDFNGSYVLALAGYNAGPHRVHEWMTQIGDPRQSDVDAIDWVESIPLNETRNYVERIIESLQIYRARLAGGHAPLQIMQDLKR